MNEMEIKRVEELLIFLEFAIDEQDTTDEMNYAATAALLISFADRIGYSNKRILDSLRALIKERDDSAVMCASTQ